MPTNRETASFLRRLASLQDLEGVARSRPRILRDAADAIDAWESPVVAETLEDEGFKVGEEPRRELLSFLEGGSTALYDELAAKFPMGLLDIVAVPGIGASRARALHEELGVDSLEKLVAAGSAGTLTSIRGIGARSADKIVAAAQAVLAERADAAGSPAPSTEPEQPEPADGPVAADPDAADADAAAQTAPTAQQDPEDGEPDASASAASEEEVTETRQPAMAEGGGGIHDPERQGRILDQMRELTGEADADARDAEAEAAVDARRGAAEASAQAGPVFAAMRCLACHATGLTDAGCAAECPSCGKRYAMSRGVVDFLVVNGRPSLAQRLMEYPPYAGVYENVARPMATRLVTTRTVEEEVELAADLMGLGISGRAGALVLDVACGPGNFTRRFGERLERSGGAVVGLDLSESMLDKAVEALERRGDRNVRYVRADATRLPFGDATFDAVHCSGALHLMRGIDGVLQEFARVVKPGGVVVIGTFILGRNPLKRVLKRVSGRGVGFKWFDRKDLRSRLDRVGLEVSDEEVNGAALTVKSVRVQGN